MILDAKQYKDGAVVCIKLIEKKTNEVDIGRYLSSEQMLRDSRNHCVPILDSFQDPFLPEIDYIVMPVLRPYDDPEFLAVGEVVDFTTQILEVCPYPFNLGSYLFLESGNGFYAQSSRCTWVLIPFLRS